MSKPRIKSKGELAEGNRERRMRSYYKHQEEEREKSLERYYRKKVKEVSGGGELFKGSGVKKGKVGENED